MRRVSFISILVIIFACFLKSADAEVSARVEVSASPQESTPAYNQVILKQADASSVCSPLHSQALMGYNVGSSKLAGIFSLHPLQLASNNLAFFPAEKQSVSMFNIEQPSRHLAQLFPSHYFW